MALLEAIYPEAVPFATINSDDVASFPKTPMASEFSAVSSARIVSYMLLFENPNKTVAS